MAEITQFEQMWNELAFTKLLKTVRMAVKPGKMLTALLAVICICLTGWLMDACMLAADDNKNDKKFLASTVFAIANFGYATDIRTDPWIMVNAPQAVSESLEISSQDKGVFSTLWNFEASRFTAAALSVLSWEISDMLGNLALCIMAVLWAVKFHTIYSVIFFTAFAAIMSIAGGAICRSAALEFARDEKAGFTEAFGFSFSKFIHLFTAHAIPIAIMTASGSLIYLIGLAANIPFAGEILLSISLPVVLLLGFFTTLMMVGTLAGSSLMMPTIAYEGSDGYIAISRAFQYVYTRPWLMIAYSLMTALYGSISYIFVRTFTFLLLTSTHSLIGLGIFNNPDGPDKLARIWAKPTFLNLIGQSQPVPGGMSETISYIIIHLIILVVVGVVVAFVISFYFSASTIIYSLMRHRIDGVSTDRIYSKLDEIRDEGPSKT